MAHFAKIGMNGKVIAVLTCGNKDMLNADGVEDESVGQNRLQEIHGWPAAMWIQTSYNTRHGVHALGGTPLRKNYAGVGYTYDSTRDAFIPPKPFASWVLNEDTCIYDPPVAYPTGDSKSYIWDESVYQADNTKGWVEDT